MIRFYGFLLLLVIVSCTDSIGRKPEPDGLIPQDKLEVILKELILVESHVQSKYTHVSQFRETMKRSGDAILKKNGVSYEQFDASMTYYGSRQNKMQEIYASVLESLNKESGKLGEMPEGELQIEEEGFVKRAIPVKGN